MIANRTEIKSWSGMLRLILVLFEWYMNVAIILIYVIWANIFERENHKCNKVKKYKHKVGRF